MNNIRNRKYDTYLLFKLNMEVFGIEVSKVCNIVECSSIIRCPGAPELFAGVANLKEFTIPVIDLKPRFNMPQRELKTDSGVIVLYITNDNGTSVIGIIADVIREVLEINPDELGEVPSEEKKPYSYCISHLWQIKNREVKIIDPDRLFTDDEIDHFKLISEVQPVIEN